MNLALWLGVAFGAASLLFLYLANQKSNEDTAQIVTDKVNKFLERIDTVEKNVAIQPASSPKGDSAAAAEATSARREAQQKLADIQNDFSQWAADFVKNRDLKKVELDRAKLETRGTEIQISKDYRPLFQHAVDTLRGIIDAYNKKAGTNFKVQLSDLPANLYIPDNLLCEIGVVDFGDDVRWRVYVYANKPAAADNPPFFNIDIQHPHFNMNDAFRIQITPPNFKIIAYGGGVATAAKVDTTQPLDSFEVPIRSSLQKLVETQITSLPTS
jgi:hypothetical protein